MINLIYSFRSLFNSLLFEVLKVFWISNPLHESVDIPQMGYFSNFVSHPTLQDISCCFFSVKFPTQIFVYSGEQCVPTASSPYFFVLLEIFQLKFSYPFKENIYLLEVLKDDSSSSGVVQNVLILSITVIP